jgi:glutamate synthase domain-containing protein 2
MGRKLYYIISVSALGVILFIGFFITNLAYHLLYIALPLILLGVYNIFQKKSNILRNYPVWGYMRYILLSIRPQIHQYYVATNQSGRPFSREMRELVYHRAEKTLETVPFGTQRDVDTPGFEWINHSLAPTDLDPACLRTVVGGAACTQPYNASRLNISAMSFGALSSKAVRALNRGAKMGNFAHNTGEGGLSRYHLMEGGDIIWQIGTGYFGCKTKDRKFDPVQFKEKSRLDVVKMIEIKLSQGAKPAHGGILPAIKVSTEIAAARGVERGEDCISPPAHSAFSTPIELLEFVQTLRELSGGKPVGFKLCVGIRRHFMAICKAMLKTKIYPDFITVDGSEGGTGAAPVEFSDFIGTPLAEGLSFVHNSLVGAGLRDKLKIIASGKVVSGFDMVTKIALGADLCNSARGMMFALGCVQSRRCHENTCPTGVTTQDSWYNRGLDVDNKAPRVHNFHDATLESLREVLGAAGLERPEDLTPAHVRRQISEVESLTYGQIYHYLRPNAFNTGHVPEYYAKIWELASANEFGDLLIEDCYYHR